MEILIESNNHKFILGKSDNGYYWRCDSEYKHFMERKKCLEICMSVITTYDCKVNKKYINESIEMWLDKHYE